MNDNESVPVTAMQGPGRVSVSGALDRVSRDNAHYADTTLTRRWRCAGGARPYQSNTGTSRQLPSLIADSWAMMPGTVRSMARLTWLREPL